MVAVGTTSCSSSSRFGPTSTFNVFTPVMMGEVSKALAGNDPGHACYWLEKTWRILRRGLKKAERRKLIINRFIRREREKRLAGKGGGA
jgi:hypothetical protein